MWMHNVRTDARTVGLGGEGRPEDIFVLRRGLPRRCRLLRSRRSLRRCARQFRCSHRPRYPRCPRWSRCPHWSRCAKRPRCPRRLWRHRLARIFVQVHDRLPHKRPLLFFRVFACPPPPGRCVRYLRRKRPFLFVFSPVTAAFGCLSDPVLFFLGIFAY